jgi:hypothetical protein
MHKLIKSSVRRIKKEVKNYMLRPREVYSVPIKAKENKSLINRGKIFVLDILKFKIKNLRYTSKTSSKEYLKKNKNLFTKNNLKAILAYIFSDFSMDQLEDMIRYIFGDLTPLQREDVLCDILDHISEKEYGFLLKN